MSLWQRLLRALKLHRTTDKLPFEVDLELMQSLQGLAKTEQRPQDEIAAELLSFVAEKVEPWQRPDRVEVMLELPRSFLGKVLRREVREALASRPSTSSGTTKGETA